MKKFILIILLIIGFLPKSQVKQGFVIPPHPRVGLSLSGGGAKGFTHIGVLKVLDSLGVKIDYISGTSMGAIVGGLYASGYSGKEIEKIVLDTDFYTIIANEKTRVETSFLNKSIDKYLITVPIQDGKINVLPKAISTGQKNIYLLKELFRNVSTIDDFSKLPIPFMCVATNLETGSLNIFEKGDLSQAIMASSAFPGLMDPVKIGDSLYIDGAMTINYPSKPLRDKGIDVVIGVDLSQGLAKRSDLNSAISILNQVIDFGIQRETINQYKYTDINIHPDLGTLGATSYDAKKQILDSGYVEAKKYITILDKLPKKTDTVLRAPMTGIYSNIYKIDSLQLVNNNIFSSSYVQGKMNLKTPALLTYGNINKMIDKLYATNNYKLINYDVIQKDNLNILRVDVQEDDTRFFLKFGLHYDEIFKTGLLLNATAKRLFFRNSTISLDGIIGDKPRYYFNYFIDNGYIPGFGVYASGMSFNTKTNSGDIIKTVNWFRTEAYIQSIYKEKYALGGGISNDIFKIRGNPTETYYNAYIFLRSDTQDDKEFPTRGFYLNAVGKSLDLFNKNILSRSYQAKADVKIHFPVTSRLTYSVRLFTGFTVGSSDYENYKYSIGGIFEQNLNNFVPFDGYQLGEITDNNILLASNSLQYSLSKNFFFTGTFSIANLFEDIQIKEFLNVRYKSAGLTAGYKSPFGQIKVNYSHPLNNGHGNFNVILGHWF
ncbi:patatin-like phospholipase family protein [Halpernia frigidisoli]|uniref:NTE family protein n=1 Tax=Halpernia frigidisoli TaxID=1125876 RepID=A0A1I3H0C1_9FLAO|nr:patatin-like phospholipase family protein [Halpernia frigidisoli]SFI29139.1 NTE family protein [Halpernia frigidisoli]